MNDNTTARPDGLTNSPPVDPAVRARQHWLSVLAHAPAATLTDLADKLMTGTPVDTLRAPETGLVMVRARMANQGDRFNLGEATMTRCVLRHTSGSGTVSVGVGYVLGRDAGRARLVALADALLQQPEWHQRLHDQLITPLAQATAARRARQQQDTARSRVQFFTLQPEAAA